MDGVASDPVELARDLRTIADRLEDGEYTTANMEISRPSRSGDNPGHFKLEFYTEEEFRRMGKVFDSQKYTEGDHE